MKKRLGAALLGLVGLALFGCSMPERAATGTFLTDGRDFGEWRFTRGSCYEQTEDGADQLSIEYRTLGGPHPQLAHLYVPNVPAPEFVDLKFPWSHVRLSQKECSVYDVSVGPEKVDGYDGAFVSGHVRLFCDIPERADKVEVDVRLSQC